MGVGGFRGLRSLGGFSHGFEGGVFSNHTFLFAGHMQRCLRSTNSNSDYQGYKDYIRVLLYSYYTTVTGRGVLLTYGHLKYPETRPPSLQRKHAERCILSFHIAEYTAP